MGACVSSHHNPSAMKVHVSSGSNRKPDNHLVIPPSPIKERPPIISGNVSVKPQFPPLHPTANPRDFGGKEETFFDSQTWLESDCEDDFMSVNGEFTPSRGNTPVHHNFPAGAPPIKGGGALTINDREPSITPPHPSASPLKKKKRLSELFQESLRGNHDLDEENAEPADETGVVESREVVAVRGGGVKPKRERWAEVVHVDGCLPSLLSSCRLVTTQEAEVRRK